MGGLAAAEQDWLIQSCGGSVREFYDELGVTLPDRTGASEAAVRCFASPAEHNRGDRRPSCSVNLITGLWHCKGCGLSGNPYGAAVALGHSETRARELAKRYGLFLESRSKDRSAKCLPTERQLRKWRERLCSSRAVVARLAEVRGWNEPAIMRCGLGWDGERVVFPIRDRRLKIAGLVRYLPGGNPKTLALPGSKRELFPAPEITSRKRPLFLVEGEPDAVAVWSCGHQAVAVPGAGSWKPEWAQRLMGRWMVVLPDCDQQGRVLAERVAAATGGRIVDLAPERTDGYDIGDFVLEAHREGGTGQLYSVLNGFAGEVA